MYAVIESGGKQYRVEVGTELEVELLDAEPGQSITLDRVLLVADGDEASIGQPVVANAAVEAEVVRRDRGEKLIVFKYRPKARSRVKKGHRQELTILRITDVRLGSKSAAESVRKAEADAKTERERLEEAAARQASADAALAAKLAKTAKADAKAEADTKTGKATGKTATKSTAKAAPKSSPKPKAKADADADAPKTSTRKKAGKADTDGDTDAAPKGSRTKKDE
jgi:large subunit ribosomal protein L21